MDRIAFLESISGIEYPEMIVEFFDQFIALKYLVEDYGQISVQEKSTNGISFVKFKPTSEELMLFSTLKDSYTIDVVGTCNYSSFDDTAQIMIIDYNLTKNTFWDF